MRSVAKLDLNGRIAAFDAYVAPRFKAWFVALVVAGALVRLLAAVFLGDVDPATASIWESGGLAIESLKHGILTGCISDPDNVANCLMGSDGKEAFLFQSAFVPPLPIFLFMAVFKLFGVSKTALAIMLGINVVGGTIAVYYCGRVAAILFDSRGIVLLATLFAAFHPVLVYSVATYHGVNVYLPLILCLFDLCSSRHRYTLKRAIGVGAFLGVTVLIRTEYLFLGAAILAGAALAHRKFLLTIVSVVVACCVISPWTIRNYLVFHRFMPVVSTVGYALYKGFDPLANGSGHWVDVNGVAKRLIGDRLAQVPHTPTYEVDLDDVYHRAANEYIASHPVDAYVLLPLKKFSLFWLFDWHDPTTHQALYQLAFWPLFVTSLAGLFMALRLGLFRHPDHRTVLLYFVAQTVVVVGYAVHARYRLNVEPFLFGYSALAIAAALSKFMGNTGPRSA